MAIALHHGTYAVQQESDKRSVLQLKLTDSALRTIELYQDNVSLQKEKPTIRFDGNQGVIQIPTGDGEHQTFTFQLSALTQSTAIDCLQQHGTRAPYGRVSVLGEIQQKITVNATDDSYNATKKRMEIVKELEKNISTKVIKQPSVSKSGKKFPRRQVMDKKPFSQGSNSTLAGRPSHSFSRSASPLVSASARSVSPANVNEHAGVRSKTKPTLTSLSSTSLPKPSSSNMPGRPLQERVLHVLAVRPIRYQELVNRLSRSSSSPPDKSKLDKILQQIASAKLLRPGATEYTLNTNCYADVQLDWPAYTVDDKASVKRKLSEISQQERENRKRQFIPSADASTRNSPNTHVQINIQEESYSNPMKKKPRVSLFKKTSPNSRPRSVSPLESNSSLSVDPSLLNVSSIVNLKDSDMSTLGLPSLKQSRKRSPSRPPSASGRTSKSSASSAKYSSHKAFPPLSESFKPSSSSTVKQSGPTKRNKDVADSNINNASKESNPKPMGSNASPHVQTLSQGSKQSPLNTDNEEFLQQYGTIDQAAQREEYKVDFNSEYKEYLLLHKKVIGFITKFGEWRSELAGYDDSTEEYKKLARHIYAEFHQFKKSNDLARFNYLQRKLKHIKARVYDFDRRVLLNNDRENGSALNTYPFKA